MWTNFREWTLLGSRGESGMIHRTPDRIGGRSRCRQRWMRTIGCTRLQCFAPACRGCGRKAADDRRFLEALHFFTVENVRWRALPERFGHWNSVWKRFDRLSKAGVFEAFFDALASMSSTAHLIQMFNSTIVRAHVSAAGATTARPANEFALLPCSRHICCQRG